jgi:hypothetical protein
MKQADAELYHETILQIRKGRECLVRREGKDPEVKEISRKLEEADRALGMWCFKKLGRTHP